MGPVRDYPAEYARRIANAMASGLSRSQGRGHPRAREPLASQDRAGPGDRYDPRLELGLRDMLRGRSLNKAAKDAHVAPERLRNYFAESDFADKQRGRWTFRHDQVPRRMLIYADGKAVTVVVIGSEAASLIGRYMNAVKAFLRTNDPAHLVPFKGDRVTDNRGKAYVLETRPNVLYRLTSTGDDTFEQIYRIVV